MVKFAYAPKHRMRVPESFLRFPVVSARRTATAVAALSTLLAASACKKDQQVAVAGEVVLAAAAIPTPGMNLEATKASKTARALVRRSNAQLDSTLARLEHVEGLLHLVKALDAWDAQQHASAGKELRAAADNLERGARHAHLELGARALAATANARAAARRLQQSGALEADEFWRLADELNAELRALGERIRRKTSSD